MYAATGLADAQLRRIYAFAGYQIAQVNLARATGTLLGYGQIRLADSAGNGAGESFLATDSH